MNRLSKKQIIFMLLWDLIAAWFYAVSINVFTLRAAFAPGGVSGLAVILNHLIRIPVGLASILINIPIIVLTFRRLGLGFFLRSLKTMALSALITDLTAPILPVFTGNRVLSALLAGVCMGIAVGIVFAQGSSFGSSDFVTMAIKKAKPGWPVGAIAWVVNVSVILLAALVFRQWLAVALGILHTLADCVVLEIVMKPIQKINFRCL